MNCHRARTCLRKPPRPSFKVARVIALWGLAIYLLFLFFLEKSAIHIFFIPRWRSHRAPAPMVLKALRRQGVQGGALTRRRRLGAQGGQFFKAEVQRLDANATPRRRL
jgi:hypothetical protein